VIQAQTTAALGKWVRIEKKMKRHEKIKNWKLYETNHIRKSSKQQQTATETQREAARDPLQITSLNAYFNQKEDQVMIELSLLHSRMDCKYPGLWACAYVSNLQ
jgi:hypothetical protein